MCAFYQPRQRHGLLEGGMGDLLLKKLGPDRAMASRTSSFQTRFQIFETFLDNLLEFFGISKISENFIVFPEP